MLEACFSSCYLDAVPNKVSLEGDADEKVNLQVKIPRWLKVRVYEHAKAMGKDITDFVQDVLRQATEGKAKRKG